MNIYFSGIGGVGIGPLAEMAIDAGYQVQGSDRNESSITSMLRSRGVAIDFIQDGTFLEACHSDTPIDWFVHTAALPDDHLELVLARKLGIHIAKRDELLARIIKDKRLKLIAVTGTHGKTTTTGMLIWLFKQLGIPVSYSIGTTLSFGPSGKYDPESDYFIYECDEFDRNFLHFHPFLSIILSIDYDHPDVYANEKDYRAAFKQFISQSDMTIMWTHDNTADIGATAQDGWIIRDGEMVPLNLPGLHYRQNGTLALKAIEYLKLTDPQTAREILDRFPGTDRRFERLGDNLYSDYGHHPSEIKAMLQLAHEVSDRVVLVYQPHQNIRQHEIREHYTNCFEQAEKVYWLPTYLSREDPNLPILTPQELTQNITNRSSIEISEMDDALWDNIQKARDEGKLVLCMGAGTIDSWVRKHLGC